MQACWTPYREEQGVPLTTRAAKSSITKPNGDTGTQFTQNIQLRALVNGSDPSLNIKLTGGELVRIPIIGTVVVTGNVHLSGVYPVQDVGSTTVLTAIAQAQGIGDFKPPMVYIYRPDDQGVKHEIPVDIKSILARKKPDVILQARDVLYVPDNNFKKNHQHSGPTETLRRRYRRGLL